MFATNAVVGEDTLTKPPSTASIIAVNTNTNIGFIIHLVVILLTQPHSRHVITTLFPRFRTVQFLPGTQNALHSLQNRRLHRSGMRTLYLVAIRRASATYRFANRGFNDACSNSVLMRSRAVRFCALFSVFLTVYYRE